MQRVFFGLWVKKIFHVVKRVFFFPFFAEKKILHNLFEITIFIKGLNGSWEIIFGVLLLFFKTDSIYNIIIALSKYGFASNYLIRQADNFSLGIQYFIAVYFLFYGAVNIFLMVGLLRGKLWAYPAAIIFFVLFITYLCYRFYVYRSGLLLFFITFDILFVVLTFLEYKRVKKLRKDTVGT